MLAERRFIGVLVALLLLLGFAMGATFKALDYEGLNLVNPLDVTPGGGLTDGTLNAAIAKIGSAQQTLIVTPGTWTISKNLTIPGNIHLLVANGGQFSVLGGKILTISGSFEALVQPVFGGAGRVIFDRLTTVRPEWFGMVCNGSTDDARAIQAAISALPASAGTVIIGRKSAVATCAVGSELTLSSDTMQLVGAWPGTTLKAMTPGQVIVRLNASFGRVADMHLDCAGVASTTGLHLGPTVVQESGTTEVLQNFNTIDNLLITSCTEGIVMKAGPKNPANGADSQNFYNRFYNVHVLNSTRGLYLTKVMGPGSNVNRNQFYAMRFGAEGSGSMNTGVHIECGDTNSFFGISFEGIQGGRLPTNPPTGVLIPDECPRGNVASNQGNRFYAPTFEAVTRDGSVGTAGLFYGLLGVGGPSNLLASGAVAYGYSTRIPSTTSPQVLTVGAVPSTAQIPATETLTAFLAPNANFGLAALFRADSAGRGIAVTSSDFNNAANAGSVVHVQPTGLLKTINGTSAYDYLNVKAGLRLECQTLASLGAPGDNGLVACCADCARPTGINRTCAGNGPGALAIRIAGSWICY